jgi:hypothetical protein
LAANAPVVTLKVADDAPAFTLTEAGVVRLAVESVIAAVVPPAGAGCARVTVQAPEECGPRLAGVQFNPETVTDVPARFTVQLLEFPLYVAVSVAVWLPVIAPAAILNVNADAPAAIVIEAGALKTLFVFAIVIRAPPAGAMSVMRTVQVPPTFDPNVVGPQTSADNTAAEACNAIFAFTDVPL